MTTRDRDVEEWEPLVVRTSAEETSGEFVRFELTLYPRGPTTEREVGLPHRRWSIDFPTEHVHPHQDERWEVLSGGLHVTYGGTEKRLDEGEGVTLPAGVPHRIRNPLDEPSRVVLEFRPAHDAQTLTETLFVLAQTGETNEKGHLHPLQFAVTQAAHPDHLYLTAVPRRVQRALVGMLAPIGRRAGYRPTYRLDASEDDHRDR
jgi:mannose-6-phosphate isomerase-like protein (cupin superfamily)